MHYSPVFIVFKTPPGGFILKLSFIGGKAKKAADLLAAAEIHQSKASGRCVNTLPCWSESSVRLVRANRLLGKTARWTAWQPGNVRGMFWWGFSSSVCGSRWLIAHQDVLNWGLQQGQNSRFDSVYSLHSLCFNRYRIYIYRKNYVLYLLNWFLALGRCTCVIVSL